MGRVGTKIRRMTSWRQVGLLLLTIAAALVFTACENNLSSLIGEAESEQLAKNQLAVPSTSVPSGRALTSWEDIVFDFDSSIDVSSLVVSGSLADNIGSSTWSDTPEKNDTLSLQPETGSLWPAGSQSIIISCRSVAGKNLVNQEFTWQIFDGMCVDDDAPVSGTDGSAANPHQKIQDGIDDAWDVYVDGAPGKAADVRVADGIYQDICSSEVGSENYVAKLQPDISILGGWSEDFTTRDTVSRSSVIMDISTSSSNTSFQPLAPILCENNITAATEISGFTITLPAYTLQVATTGGIYCVGTGGFSTPIIRWNTITGPGSRADEAYGIMLRDSDATVTNNIIENIDAENRAYGIAILYLNYSTDSPEISNNDISGMYSTNQGGFGISAGIFVSKNDAYINNNSITMNRGDDQRFAILLQDTEDPGTTGPRIEYNTINIGSFVEEHVAICEAEFITTSDPGTLIGNYFTGIYANYYWDSDYSRTAVDTLWDSPITIAGNPLTSPDTLPGLGNTCDEEN